MRQPRLITNLDPVNASNDDDILAIVQITPETRGTPNPIRRTFRMTWADFTKRISDVITADRASMVQAFADQLAMIQAQNGNIQTLVEELAARKAMIALPDVGIPAASLITLTGGTLTFTRPCVGIRTTDAVVVSPKALSAGYGLRSFSIPANDQLTISLHCPILSVGGTAQNFGVTALR